MSSALSIPDDSQQEEVFDIRPIFSSMKIPDVSGRSERRSVKVVGRADALAYAGRLAAEGHHVNVRDVYGNLVTTGTGARSLLLRQSL